MAMDRDCGRGKLIPVRYTIEWCVGQSDTSNEKNIIEPYSGEYEVVLATLPRYSNIRMYVWDKQGYANCIKSTYVSAEGVATEGTNRLAELD